MSSLQVLLDAQKISIYFASIYITLRVNCDHPHRRGDSQEHRHTAFCTYVHIYLDTIIKVIKVLLAFLLRLPCYPITLHNSVPVPGMSNEAEVLQTTIASQRPIRHLCLLYQPQLCHATMF